MDSELKTILEIFTMPVLTVGGGLFAFYKWRHELIEERALRSWERRWQQAQAAKDLLDDLSESRPAQNALLMLDFDELEFDIGDGEPPTTVSEKDYLSALRVTNMRFNAAETYIRNAFDELFYFMSLLEHHVATGLVVFEDVRFPLDYFMPTINRNRQTFDDFLAHFKLKRAQEFLKRMDRELGEDATPRPSWRAMEAQWRARRGQNRLQPSRNRSRRPLT